MNKEKIYVLQKDLPDGSKAGDEYNLMELSDKVYINRSQFTKIKLPYTAVENNPDWFKLKEEPKPTVVGVEERVSVVLFQIEYPDKLKHPVQSISKERLAEILIQNTKDNFVWSDEIAIGFSIFCEKNREKYCSLKEFPKAVQDFKNSQNK